MLTAIHLLSNGESVGHVNWVDYFTAIYPSFSTDELKSAKPAHIDITSDLQYMIITFHATKYGILKVALNEYFQVLSSHLHPQGPSSTERHHSVSGKDTAALDEDEVDYTRGGTSVSTIGAPGNRSWRNLLASAKEIVKRKDKFSDRTDSIWKVVEESGKCKDWYDHIHGLSVQS